MALRQYTIRALNYQFGNYSSARDIDQILDAGIGTPARGTRLAMYRTFAPSTATEIDNALQTDRASSLSRGAQRNIYQVLGFHEGRDLIDNLQAASFDEEQPPGHICLSNELAGHFTSATGILSAISFDVPPPIAVPPEAMPQGSIEMAETVITQYTPAITQTPWYGLIEQQSPVIPPPTDFFNTYAPSPDSQLIYVDPDLGDDANDGLSTGTPVKTFWRAYVEIARDGFPDWIHMKCGTQENGGLDTNVTDYQKSGRSESEPLVITQYGAGAYPEFILKQEWRSQNVVEVLRWNVWLSVDFRNPRMDENDGAYDGLFELDYAVRYLCQHEGIIFEDCKFSYINKAINLNQRIVGQISKNIKLIGCRFYANFVQGVLFNNTDGLLVEECIFDHNGHHPISQSLPNGVEGPTVRRHNAYFKSCKNARFTRNMWSRGSAQGPKVSGDDPGDVNGVLYDFNVSYANGVTMAFGFSSGHTGDYTHTNCTVEDNVFTKTGRTSSEWVDGAGSQSPGLQFRNQNGAMVQRNFFIYKDDIGSSSACSNDPGQTHVGVVMQNNTVYEFNIPASREYFEDGGWPTTVIQNNDEDLPPATYVNPEPVFVDDAAAIAWFNAAIAQNKSAWTHRPHELVEDVQADFTKV